MQIPTQKDRNVKREVALYLLGANEAFGLGEEVGKGHENHQGEVREEEDDVPQPWEESRCVELSVREGLKEAPTHCFHFGKTKSGAALKTAAKKAGMPAPGASYRLCLRVTSHR